MFDIKDIFQSNSIIAESISEPHIKLLAKQLKDKGESLNYLSRIIGSVRGIDWENLTPSKVRVVNGRDSSSVKKMYRNSTIVLGFVGDNCEYIFNDLKTGIKLFPEIANTRQVYKDLGSRNGLKESEILDYLWGCDEVVGITYSNDRYNLHNQRINDCIGMIENTPEQNAEIAKANIERYKQIVAQNGTTKYLDADDIMEEATKLLIKVTKDARRDDNVNMWDINKCYETLVKYYMEFSNRWFDVKKGSSYEFQRKELKEKYELVKTQYEELKRLCSK